MTRRTGLPDRASGPAGANRRILASGGSISGKRETKTPCAGLLPAGWTLPHGCSILMVAAGHKAGHDPGRMTKYPQIRDPKTGRLRLRWMGLWFVALLVAAFLQTGQGLPKVDHAESVRGADAVIVISARPSVVKPSLPDRKVRLLDAPMPAGTGAIEFPPRPDAGLLLRDGAVPVASPDQTAQPRAPPAPPRLTI